jgi:hypothetical protein
MPNFKIVHKLTEVECLRWRLLLTERAKIDAEIRALGLEIGGTVSDTIAPHGDGYAVLRLVEDAPAPSPAPGQEGTRG